MVVYLWKFLWKKTQSSLQYVKIGLCAIVVYLLIFSIFANVFKTNKQALYPSSAKSISVQQDDKIKAFITDKKINATKSGKIVVAGYRLLTCSLVGVACYDNLDKKNPSNATSFLASIFAYPFLHPPASGIGVVTQTLAQAGFIPKSYAAEGIGFASISPLIDVWKALRDVAYLCLVLVIVTIGFMIMLRTKINPQTVVNVENALPKIVMTLIYITFSFAIAGFLIDLMYVSIILVITILGPQYSHVTPNILFGTNPKTTQDLIATFLQASPWKVFDMIINFNVATIFVTLPNAILSILGDLLGFVLRMIILIISIILINPLFDKIINGVTDKLDIPAAATPAGVGISITGILAALVKSAGGGVALGLSIIAGFVLSLFLLGLVIFITVIMLFFRIFLLLFSNYIKLLLLIIISPLFLLLEAIPGQSTFSSWIKNLLELLVPFPVIIATFLIGSIVANTSTSGTLWTPPFLWGINAQYLSTIIGMWMLFMIPEFIGIAQKAINPKPLPLDAGLGTFFGGAKTGIETGLGEASKYAILSDRIGPLGALYKAVGMGGQRNKPGPQGP